MPAEKSTVTNSVIKQTECEKCAVCHSQTNVPLSMPVELRQRFVTGIGELCADCYYEYFEKREDI